VAVAGVTGRVPPVLRRQLRYQTFRHYCRLNVALEASAELAYERLVELCDDPGERATFERIRDDEGRHTAAFRVLVDALTEDDRLAAPSAMGDLVARLAAISPWFVPAPLRATNVVAGRAGAGPVREEVAHGGPRPSLPPASWCGRRRRARGPDGLRQ
jgi:hypothetical protein